MDKYIVFFDSGSTNSRVYLLDKNLNLLYTAKKNVGSRNSSMEGSNAVLVRGLYELYTDLLANNHLTEENVEKIYMSGLITCPYGIVEVPHVIVPIPIQEFAQRIYCHYEDTLFKRNLYLVPGIKTVNEDFSFAGNMRGEEIEMIGALDELKEMGITEAALMMPGSHTHITHMKDEVFNDIISNFTGELFYSIKKETMLASVLNIECDELDPEMVRKAMENLEKFGFNRALYICHAMRMMDAGTPEQRFAYAEGVINGGLRKTLEYYCETRWQSCDTLVIASDEFMYKLFSIIFDGSPYIKRIVWLPISEKKSYALEGLKKLLSMRGEI